MFRFQFAAISRTDTSKEIHFLTCIAQSEQEARLPFASSYQLYFQSRIFMPNTSGFAMKPIDALLYHSMFNLATEIQLLEARYKDSPFVPRQLLQLYDQADELFCADNVKKLLAAVAHEKFWR